MAVNILGLSAFYHDSAACLVQDGVIRSAAQEERFSRNKFDASFPARAVAYCLSEAGISHEDLDLVVFYDKPLLKFERILESYLAYAPRGFGIFRRGLPLWLRRKLHLPRELDRGLGGRFSGRYVFLEHHESHAASAFFPSPYDEAAILTLDGVGEWATGSIAHGRGNRIEMLKELRFPHSLGMLYSAFTYMAGFRVNSGEYKLMGLAPYGKPTFRQHILEHLLDLKADGSFRLNMDYFQFGARDRMITPKMHQLFGGPPREPDSPITEREMNLAASIQSVTEEIVLRIARHAREVTGCSNLVMAGGVALNCVANGKIVREGIFDDLWVQPASGDSGGALGAALFAWHQLMDRPRKSTAGDRQRASLLGPKSDSSEVRAFLDRKNAVYRHFPDEDELCDHVAQLLADQMVVGHMAGRMEFGPRALGNRSILGDPRSPEMQSQMNLKVKFRESFRPFAPAVLREHAHEFFELERGRESPYMLLVCPVDASKRITPADDESTGLDKLKQPRSVVPAITHVDGSARVQTVDADRYPRFHKLLTAFHRKTGTPMLINTSFNVRGEPIVNTPEDAYRCFEATNMDALVLEDCVLLRSEQRGFEDIDPATYRSAYALD
jgi:carbamoyltransferase